MATIAKHRAILSFTVFAMFFGAGNLIFPVFLAYESGREFLPAFIGFTITAIGLPVLSLLAIGRAGSLSALASRVHPAFSCIFTIAIYLTIGPCLAIPRTASTSFEMIKAATGTSSQIASVLYSAAFFAAGGIMALHPEKLSKRLGRILSPILILLIAILVAGIAAEEAPLSSAYAGRYSGKPFAVGFAEGYQTMDAIAGLVFELVLAINLNALGIKAEEAPKEGLIASALGGLLLLVVYSALAFIGIKSHAIISDPSNGADILSAAAANISSQYGRFLIAAIFIIACFNTSTSLLSSCGEYFSHLCPRVSRGRWIAIFAIISGIIANAGLDMIIGFSAPVLSLIYPGAIMLIATAFIPDSHRLRHAYRLGVGLALAASALSFIGVSLPLSSAGFGWLIPGVLGGAAGYAIDRKSFSV